MLIYPDKYELMGSYMKGTVVSFLDMVDNADFEGTSLLLDDILADAHTISFSLELERIVEQEDTFHLFQLKIRDHVFDYLKCQGLYFALRIPSYQLLQLVSEHYERNKAVDRLLELVYMLNSQDDPTLDLSFVEIDSLKNSIFVVLIPELLSRRESELSNCVSYYSEAAGLKYSISELLKTHYGKKIAAACDIDPQHPVIRSREFDKLRKAMSSLGLDIGMMQSEVPKDNWYEYATAASRRLNGGNLKSREMQVLHKTAYARLRLSSGNPSTVGAALLDISNSKTRFCNDAVVRIATVGSDSLRTEAVRVLEASKDLSQVGFLSSLIRDSSGGLRTALATAVSSLSSSTFASSIPIPNKKKERAPIVVHIPPNLRMVYNRIISTITESRTLHLRLDAIRSLATFNIPEMEKDLKKLMLDSDPRIRLAVLELAETLPRYQSHGLISIALEDKEDDVVTKATSILESRWPDDFW